MPTEVPHAGLQLALERRAGPQVRDMPPPPPTSRGRTPPYRETRNYRHMLDSGMKIDVMFLTDFHTIFFC